MSRGFGAASAAAVEGRSGGATSAAAGPAVLKIGGRLVETPEHLRRMARSVARYVASKPGDQGLVLVHGGGAQVSELGRRLGHAATFHEGQRVTDEPTLRLVSMVLSGSVNKSIVRALLNAGVRAAGLSGEDGATLRADVAAGGALGHVGVIRAVDVTLPQALLATGFVPVLSPVSAGPDGEPLNVNADLAAVALAAALGASRLVLASDVSAVRDGAGVEIPTLHASAAGDLVRQGVAAGGMVPKIQAARAALEANVVEVRIGSLDALFSGGTRVVQDRLAEVAS